VTAAVTALGATDVMHFLGRKPHHACQSALNIDPLSASNFDPLCMTMVLARRRCAKALT